MKEDIELFLTLVNLAERIQDIPDIDWKTKYNIIFSKYISEKINELPFYFDKEYSDHGYEDDIRAYVRSAKRVADQLKKVLEVEL